jgi:hypothetical protein
MYHTCYARSYAPCALACLQLRSDDARRMLAAAPQLLAAACALLLCIWSFCCLRDTVPHSSYLHKFGCRGLSVDVCGDVPSSPRLSGSSTATDASPVCKAENNQQCWHWHLAIVAACYAQAMTNQLQGVAQGTTLHCASDHSCARQVYFNDSVPTFDRDVHWPVFDTDPDAPAAAAREQRLYLWNKKFVQHFVESTEPLSVRPFRKAAELQVA